MQSRCLFTNNNTKEKKNPFRKKCQTKNPPDSDPDFSLNVFYLSHNNKLDRTQVQRTYEVFSYIQFYNNTKHAKWT
jgi:hypothetical protein